MARILGTTSQPTPHTHSVALYLTLFWLSPPRVSSSGRWVELTQLSNSIVSASRTLTGTCWRPSAGVTAPCRRGGICR